ncbi:uncharacterized protein LOC133879045 [Alnus glutinosa]|uniref:uncharacterized protein LOC133879045 n=1 Tax=Alnus glutinosa TaxID=3517 RepID=UPI002D783424|nr:uncharacterized protein LOC133879045 [Alnus glutinosa]
MWVAWPAEANCLKRRTFWQVSVPVSCSWSWKKLLPLRDLAKKFIWFKVGDRSRVFLWLDHWHPASYLLDQYGYRIVYDSSFSLNTKRAAVIKNGNWFWASARSDTLVDIQSQLHEVALGYIDELVCDSRNGKYTCVETWGKLRVSFLVVNWWKLVLFPVAIPKHAFILWLVFWNALVTKQNMYYWGYNGIAFVCSVIVLKRVLSISSLDVASVPEFGQILWPSALCFKRLWTGMIFLVGELLF